MTLNHCLLMRLLLLVSTLFSVFILSNCASSSGGGNPSMSGPSIDVRNATIAAEPRGNYFIGRRYYVEKTRFWGYVRKPRQSWSKSKLVMMNESKKKNPDRFSENGSGDRRYGFDSNYEYKLYGRFTGEKAYDPNSNQILPEFLLTGYEVLDKDPGWLFSPSDKYNSKALSLIP